MKLRGASLLLFCVVSATAMGLTASIKSLLTWDDTNPSGTVSHWEVKAEHVTGPEIFTAITKTNGIYLSEIFKLYEKLAEGNYRFSVRAVSTNGLVSDWSSITNSVGKIPVSPENVKLMLKLVYREE